MVSYLTEGEKEISKEFLDNGFIIKKVADKNLLDKIQSKVVEMSLTSNIVGNFFDKTDWLNNIHKSLSVESLNEYRLGVIKKINNDITFKKLYFEISKPYLETLVGNELAMQKRINLSIQLPDDNSSLLPVHADTWAGDSPFEIVVWLPLVNCFGTKTMYILPQDKIHKLHHYFKHNAGNSAEDLFESIKNDIKWLDVKYGEVLLFNQALPHGNKINLEDETRWSMNCRFKSIFTPYNDKKLGEFFEPITLKPLSKLGMDYSLPSLKS